MAPTSQQSKRKRGFVSSRFPQSRRLKRKRLIQPLFDRNDQTTRSVSSGNIRLLYRTVERIETGVAAPFQVGFAVSRSLGGAVKRNRLKRMMREAFRHELASLEEMLSSTKKSVTMMMIARRLPQDEATIENDIVDVSRKMVDVLLASSVPEPT